MAFQPLRPIRAGSINRAGPSTPLSPFAALLTLLLNQAGLTIHRATWEKVLAWAMTAADADIDAAVQHRVYLTLEMDRAEKTRQIRAVECKRVKLLAGTPYVLLISTPGVNVVSAAELAGEMRLITHYASAKAITGRAGL
ncbi:MAG: hypothetical protein AB7O62_08960 [Pirellulales bacterium]